MRITVLAAVLWACAPTILVAQSSSSSSTHRVVVVDGKKVVDEHTVDGKPVASPRIDPLPGDPQSAVEEMMRRMRGELPPEARGVLDGARPSSGSASAHASASSSSSQSSSAQDSKSSTSQGSSSQNSGGTPSSGSGASHGGGVRTAPAPVVPVAPPAPRVVPARPAPVEGGGATPRVAPARGTGRA
ncbi:MAG: hypothetical protein U1F36_22375 [Planctomycetota bacterium]